MSKKSYLLSFLADHVGARLRWNQHVDSEISGLAPLHLATSSDLSFFSHARYAAQFRSTQAKAVITSSEHDQDAPMPLLIVDKPYLAMAKLAALFDQTPKPIPGIAKTAVIHPSVVVPPTAFIGEQVVIEANCVLGERVEIGHGVVLGEGVQIGDDTCLKPRVVIYHRVHLGKRCLIHSGVVLGSDGFGNAQHQGRWIKIPQIGTLIIEDDVEVGANTTIDRGALGDTIIHSGVRLDNLIQIAHNVEIGAHTAIAANTAIAGSAEIGEHCMIGGGCAISGHLKIDDKTILLGMTGVSKSLSTGMYGSSLTARTHRDWARQIAHLNRFDQYVDRLKAVEKKLNPTTRVDDNDGHS